MTLTVKLAREVEDRFAEQCRRKNLTKSAVVKQLIEEYLQTEEASVSPYELFVEVTGGTVQAGGPGRSARDHSRLIKEKLRAGRAR